MGDFIKTYPNAFSKEYCNKVIKHFEIAEQGGFTQTRVQRSNHSPADIKDDSYYINEADIDSFVSMEISRGFNDVLWKQLTPSYIDEFPVIARIAKLKSHSVKVQRTRPGGGYHVWHFEAESSEVRDRILTWQIFLNDIEEGGETEFLYQHVRIKPVTGTAVLFPVSFTHTHRGNPPLTDTKYIMTGWINF